MAIVLKYSNGNCAGSGRRSSSIKKSVENSNEQVKKLDVQILDIKRKADSLDREIGAVLSNMVDSKISLALLKFQMESLTKTMKRSDKELRQAFEGLNEFVNRAEKVGQRIVPVKTIMDILGELRVTDGHLAALVDVSEDIERNH